MCQAIPGTGIDKAIAELLLETITPIALDVALKVQEELERCFEEVKRVHKRQLERARYEAELSRRRYMRVDPENRLVSAYIAHFSTHLDLVSKNETYEYFKNKKRGVKHDNPGFAAMAKDMDQAIGETLDLVKELGIQDNTYIFIPSDFSLHARLP